MSPILQSRANASAIGYGAFFGAAAATSYESIATVTVGSGGASSVEFTSIATDWTHLQIRFIARCSSLVELRVQLNADTGTNYAWHEMWTNANAGSSVGHMKLAYWNGFPSTADLFGAGVMDILDYKNTNKYKTLRTLSGYNNISTGGLQLNSGLWQNTNAITSVKIFPQSGSFQQYSNFALYGIKV